MPNPESDDDSIPRYKRGFEWFSHLVKEDLSGKPWRRMGIFSFYDAPYAESERLYLSPKQVVLALAGEAKKQEQGLVFVVDAMEKGELTVRLTRATEGMRNGKRKKQTKKKKVSKRQTKKTKAP